MTRYWWVNHNQTFEHERGGGYLWSPKREANGARSQFYQNMRVARAGDRVVSYASKRIRAIGRVASEATTAQKPIVFGSVGENWAADGWLLPVSWSSVNQEPRPAHYLDDIAPLLPAKYSPINPKNGFGNQKAYLAEIGEALYQKVLQLTNGQTAEEYPACDAETVVVLAEEAEVQRLHKDWTLSDTERINVIAARWGQGMFRAGLLAIDGICAITGVADPRLLRASHIKPWRLSETAAERLDAGNGLLLTPTYDHLFDKGLLTFEADGNAVLSSTLSVADIDRLALSGVRARYSLTHHDRYLTFHRSEIFVP